MRGTQPCGLLADWQRLRAAELVYQALPEFYGLITASHEQCLAALATQLAEAEGTELESSVAALDDDGRVLGVVAGYPAVEMRQRQMSGLIQLAREIGIQSLKDFLRALDEHSKSVPAIEEGNYYLARLSVSAEAQGSGLATVLMQEFAAAGAGHKALELHVRIDNARAIAFYYKIGFEIAPATSSHYLRMIRTLAQG